MMMPWVRGLALDAWNNRTEVVEMESLCHYCVSLIMLVGFGFFEIFFVFRNLSYIPLFG